MVLIHEAMNTAFSSRTREEFLQNGSNIAIRLIKSIMTQAALVVTLFLVQNVSARIELVPLTPNTNAVNITAEGSLFWSASGGNIIVNGDFENGFYGWTKLCPLNKDFIINQGDYKQSPTDS